MKDHRRGSHTVSRLTVRVVWVTKYSYAVLQGDDEVSRALNRHG